MYDKGNGFDSADIVANGPGRLETQPDRDQPVERIAIWQDKLRVQNEVGADGQVVRKMILLTGKRPCFLDQVQKSSLDSGQWIKVFLEPKAPPPPTSGELSSPTLVSAPAGGNTQTTVLASASQTEASDGKRVTNRSRSRSGSRGGGTGGGAFEIRRLLAFRDVHLLAPAKTMTARHWLDAEFFDAAPVPITNGSAPTTVASAPVVIAPTVPANPEDISAPTAARAGEVQIAADDQAAKKPAEPAVVGMAERMWVKIEMKPKPAEQTVAKAETSAAKTASTMRAKTSLTSDVTGEKTSEIREAWLWGSVALHQDPSEGKTKGEEASGEALYLDNRGKDKAITFIYQREPNATTYLPGPLPPARVENDQKIITGAGIIAMNQATDQAWVEGPGNVTQFSEQAPTPPTNTLGADRETANTTTSRTTAPPVAPTPRATSLLAQNADQPGPAAQTPDSKPKTRAGRPVGQAAPSVIRFSEGMEFNGRTVDPDGNPAGRADFFGTVTAQLQDALLHCEERMIAYTDKVVPLAQLGTLSKPLSKPSPADSPMTGAETGSTPADPGPELARSSNVTAMPLGSAVRSILSPRSCYNNSGSKRTTFWTTTGAPVTSTYLTRGKFSSTIEVITRELKG